MSQYSEIVKPFLKESLAPEIERLTMKLASLEEFGYDNDEMMSIKQYLTKLLPIYDFLTEYAYGYEECDWYMIRDIMSMTGMSILSERTVQTEIVQPPPIVSTNLTVTLNGVPYSSGDVQANEYDIKFIAPTEIDEIIVQGNFGVHVSNSNELELMNALLTAGTYSFVVIEKIGGVTKHSYTITIEVV